MDYSSMFLTSVLEDLHSEFSLAGNCWVQQIHETTILMELLHGADVALKDCDHQ